jgi:hypothetical protein
MACKGICEYNSDSQKIGGYASGQRFCKRCDHWWLTTSHKCGCCGSSLRKSARYNPVSMSATNNVVSIASTLQSTCGDESFV